MNISRRRLVQAASASLAILTLGGAPWGSIRSTGSPESREMTNTITVSSQRTTTAWAQRRRR